MGSLNKVMLIGNLGRDAESKSISNGQTVTSFSIATTETWTKDGEKKEKTEWHRCVLWGDSKVVQYLTKGKSIYVEGKLETRQWEKDGQKHYTTEIKVDRVTLLGGGERRERDNTPDYGGGYGDNLPTHAGPQPASSGAPLTKDDIPF